MSATAVLAAGAVLLAFAAGRELATGAGEGLARRLRGAVLAVSSARAPLGAKIAGTAAAAGIAGVGVPALPTRLTLPALALLLSAGFMAPDAWLERRARARRRRFVAALPDALDLLAVGSASGRSLGALLAEIAAASAGPLQSELRQTVAAIECGAPIREAIGHLRRRVPGAEVAALAAAVERSRAFGSPLAEQLHLQASTLRGEARRRVEERAAKAAPKIQLVVALVLVPSVLLVILAAILAHSDELLGGL